MYHAAYFWAFKLFCQQSVVFQPSLQPFRLSVVGLAPTCLFPIGFNGNFVVVVYVYFGDDFLAQTRLIS